VQRWRIKATGTPALFFFASIVVINGEVTRYVVNDFVKVVNHHL
jgi:hypothetical protein